VVQTGSGAAEYDRSSGTRSLALRCIAVFHVVPSSVER
jgi:hypothetical protein